MKDKRKELVNYPETNLISLFSILNKVCELKYSQRNFYTKIQIDVFNSKRTYITDFDFMVNNSVSLLS